MDITQSKKTSLYSLTKLSESDLAALHNSITDVTVQYKIQLALLDDYNADVEPDKRITERDEVQKYLEGKGLTLASSTKQVVGNLSGSMSEDDDVNRPMAMGDEDEDEDEELEEVEAI